MKKKKIEEKNEEKENTTKNVQKLSTIPDDLRMLLSMERLALKNERSIAFIENGKIKIIRRQGKWDGFESNRSYLEPHEALYLIEMVSSNRTPIAQVFNKSSQLIVS